MSEIENPTSENIEEPAEEVTAELAAPAAPTAETAPAPETAPAEAAAPAEEAKPAAPPEDISYHAVEKDGTVTALWEMQGRKHLRTIDPRSREGLAILQHYTSDHHDEPAAAPAADSATV